MEYDLYGKSCCDVIFENFVFLIAKIAKIYCYYHCTFLKDRVCVSVGGLYMNSMVNGWRILVGISKGLLVELKLTISVHAVRFKNFKQQKISGYKEWNANILLPHMRKVVHGSIGWGNLRI